MAEVKPLIVPRAIYLDANALIATPHNFKAQSIAEVVELAGVFGAELLVPELAAEEWLSRRCADAVKTMKGIVSNAAHLGNLLGRHALKCEQISHEELQAAVRKAQKAALTESGFQILPTPRIELDALVRLFLAKLPPFNDGDKGFKDAIILETIFEHACRDNKYEDIVLVSSDGAFSHPAIAARFSASGTTARLVTGSPQALFGNLTETLEAMLSDARVAVWETKHAAADAFVKEHEEQILDFAAKHAQIGMSDVMGYGLSQFGREPDETDEKLKYARIISIDAVRPKSVESGYPSPTFPLKVAEGRVPFLITVSVEIDLTIAWTNPFAERRVRTNEVSALVDGTLPWERPPERQESVTVTRKLSVFGSISSEGADSVHFRDLRLESA